MKEFIVVYQETRNKIPLIKDLRNKFDLSLLEAKRISELDVISSSSLCDCVALAWQYDVMRVADLFTTHGYRLNMQTTESTDSIRDLAHKTVELCLVKSEYEMAIAILESLRKRGGWKE